jgi:retron-type reverse transcriptase
MLVRLPPEPVSAPGVHRQLSAIEGGWVIELDIQAFLDTLDHALLREMLRQRVNNGVITRLSGKWLKAGVLEEGQIKGGNTARWRDLPPLG